MITFFCLVEKITSKVMFLHCICNLGHYLVLYFSNLISNNDHDKNERFKDQFNLNVLFICMLFIYQKQELESPFREVG